jgi:hypothetical protein
MVAGFFRQTPEAFIKAVFGVTSEPKHLLSVLSFRVRRLQALLSASGVPPKHTVRLIFSWKQDLLY